MSQLDSALDAIRITNTRPEHAQGVYDTVRAAYGVPLDEDCPECIPPEALHRQLERFPEGQFVALHAGSEGEMVVGIASTMRTNRPPTARHLPWMEAIGSMGIANHDPDGEWLYGVEMAVRPAFRRRGIGTALYQARFAMVKRLNLRGWYAGGMLMGYHRYADQMSVQEYAEKVMAGELRDPTVTMQINRGFEARGLIEDYLDEPEAGNAAILIVWHNPDYRTANE